MSGSNVKQSATVAPPVATSTTVATLLAAGGARQMCMIVNDSAAILYVKFGAGASSSDYSVAIAAGGYYEVPVPMYGGVLTGTLATGTGNARVTSY